MEICAIFQKTVIFLRKSFCEPNEIVVFLLVFTCGINAWVKVPPILTILMSGKIIFEFQIEPAKLLESISGNSVFLIFNN